MRALYFDCFSGISGDMILGAMLDLGIDEEKLKDELAKLNLKGYRIEISKKQKNGIFGTDVKVILEEHEHHSHRCDLQDSGQALDHMHSHIDHVHRNLGDILEIIEKSELSDSVKDLSSRIFIRLAKAEAKVHNQDLYDVHFHEVGAVDSVVDIVGSAICLSMLTFDKVYSSPVTEGRGFISCQHGLIPVPVPATMGVLADTEIPLIISQTEGEMVTPTGAAVLAEICSGVLKDASIVPSRFGYGMGKKDFSHPNVLRVIEGEIEEITDENSIVLLETNLDDTTPECLGYAMEQLFECGAKDVYFTPIYMKKMRPAYVLSVMCDAKDVEKIKLVIFEETGAIGLRESKVMRTILKRRIVNAETKFGIVRVKVCEHNGVLKKKPEFEDLKILAQKNHVPLREILAEVNRKI